jgi:hypothetical protein
MNKRKFLIGGLVTLMMVSALVLGSCRIGDYEEDPVTGYTFKLKLGKKWAIKLDTNWLDSDWGSYKKSGKTLTFTSDWYTGAAATFEGTLDGKTLTITDGKGQAWRQGVFKKKAVDGEAIVFDVEFEDGVQDELDGPDDEE